MLTVPMKKQCLSDDRGSVAVEFAIISLTAVITIVFILTASMVLYLNQTLDNATAQVSRQIMTGSAQAASINSSAFRVDLCKLLPRTIDCSLLVINLYVVPKSAGPSGFYNFVNADLSGLSLPDLSNGGTGQFTLGARGEYQYLQVIYPITFPPALILKWLSGGATYKGAPAFIAISTAAFRNELF
jgi:Flp pilus assembly protein TadG